MPTLRMTIVLAGDLSVLDAAAVSSTMRASLLATFPMAMDVEVSVSAASINIDCRLIMHNASAAVAAADTIASASPAVIQASWLPPALATLAVVDVRSAAISSELILAPPPSPTLPPPLSPLRTDGRSLGTGTLVGIIVSSAVVLLAVLVVLVLRCRRGNTQTVKESGGVAYRGSVVPPPPPVEMDVSSASLTIEKV